VPTLSDEPDNGWPAGPAPIGPAALAELLARVVADPDILSGRGDPNNIGASKKRLASLLTAAGLGPAKELSETLLLWLDQAGVLAEPAKPGHRLRHPRPLATTDLAEIGTRLRQTPCPDAETVRAVWAALAGRS
jgi:hypothetical protein